MASTKKHLRQNCLARRMRKGETLPDELLSITGFNMLGPVDPEWCWVIESRGDIVACVLGANGHGLFILLRIAATKAAPFGWAMVLLRKVFADVKAKGVIAYTAFLMPDDQPMEAKLARICARSGAKLIPTTGLWAAGSTDMEGI